MRHHKHVHHDWHYEPRRPIRQVFYVNNDQPEEKPKSSCSCDEKKHKIGMLIAAIILIPLAIYGIGKLID